MNVVYALFVARGALDGTWKLIANGKNFKPVDRNGWPDFQAQFSLLFCQKVFAGLPDFVSAQQKI